VGSCHEVFKFAGVAPGPIDADARPSTRISWLVPVTGLLAMACVLVMIARQLPVAGHRIRRQLTGSATVQTRLRYLAGGELVGTVLPLDPSDAGWLVWGHTQLRPFLDDRVSLFANDYAPYRRHCLDVVHDRDTSYRRTDGSLGGWRQLANVVPFDWIVTRSIDMEANLTLNSSPSWGPVYWDAEVVIFGFEQNDRVAAAAKRLAALKSLEMHGVDRLPELVSGKRESKLLILDDQSWKNYTTREFVDLARTYCSLDLPAIAEYLIMRLDDTSLYREAEQSLHGSIRPASRRRWELQDSPR
jgi:hypothetical protein